MFLARFLCVWEEAPESRIKEFSVSEIERLREREGDRGPVVGREKEGLFVVVVMLPGNLFCRASGWESTGAALSSEACTRGCDPAAVGVCGFSYNERNCCWYCCCCWVCDWLSCPVHACVYCDQRPCDAAAIPWWWFEGELRSFESTTYGWWWNHEEQLPAVVLGLWRWCNRGWICSWVVVVVVIVVFWKAWSRRLLHEAAACCWEELKGLQQHGQI